MKRGGAAGRRELVAGLAFLMPNLIGVVVFVVYPVVFSLAMAFTDWDLKLHNRFSDVTPVFVGLENFVDMLSDGKFLRYLGNTLFFMMGIPLSIAGSLTVALLLNRDHRPERARGRLALLAGALLLVGAAMMVLTGLGSTAMTLLLGGVAGGVLIAGVAGGTTVYRTIFYTPHFVAGVATFILWKKLYDPQTGPVNVALTPVLDALTSLVQAVPPGAFSVLLATGFLATAGLAGWWWAWLRRSYIDGESGAVASLIAVVPPVAPLVCAGFWCDPSPGLWLMVAAAGALWVAQVVRLLSARERFPAPLMAGFGSVLLLSAGVATAMFVLIGLSSAVGGLPAWVAGAAPTDAPGLDPPDWLNQYAWAKPALMIMGFWAAIGSNTMLLYLAALSGVPPQLYEAADIDGAGRLARFWNVTWPQLAPTTFFIVVMATIYGLQGGFEMARTMTEGGPAGATTTLSYFIFTEGFETGRLGFASAVAWALFLLIFGLTLFNWTFGNRYVNE
ncbi:MAG: hypothetical protein AAGA57_08780 [Planctomycetota bacterium]